jgi:CheY-like chemotaxis protein
MEPSRANRRHLLLVEDNPGDVHLVREAFARRPDPPEIVDVPDGLAALEYLRGDAERPDLILLDLNLPRMDGREFLAIAKNDDALRRIPVVVLSSVDAEADVDGLYDLRANGYLVKPSSLAALFALVERIDDYWLHLSALPGRNGRHHALAEARGRSARAGEKRRSS